MKRLIGILLSVVLLLGCSKENAGLKRALEFRNSLLQSTGGTFDAVITADYLDILHTFKMNCKWDSLGEIQFTVLQPDSISGITGIISNDTGKILFDDKALFFDTMADGMVSPVSAPWVALLAMRSGYIKGVGESDCGYRIELDDSYKQKALNVNLEMNTDFIPLSAEIYYDGRRVVSISFEHFAIL